MKSIDKYKLTVGDNNIEMAFPLQYCSVGLDPQGQISLWAFVDTDKPKVQQQFYVALTGEDLTLKIDDGYYINLGMVKDVAYIYHVLANKHNQSKKEEADTK